MAENDNTKWTLRRYLQSRLISGLFVLVPVWITIFVVRAVFGAMASFLRPLVELLPWAMPRGVVLAVSICAFILLVYLAGFIAAHVIGRRFLALAESLILRIPVVKAIYSMAKQIMDALSLSTQGGFKSVVLVQFPHPGMQALGFLTGMVKDGNGNILCRVFVPTALNPTTGFLELIPWRAVQETNLTVEEGIKIVVSGGVISPDTIATHPLALPS